MKYTTKRFFVFALLALSLLSSQVFAATDCKFRVALSPAGSFTAESPNLEIRGTAKRVGDTVTAENIVLKLDSLKTGIDLRDEHMKKKYFETDKYPEAVLTHATGSGGKFTGELFLHNVKKPIEGTYTFEGDEFVGTFSTKMSDYSIPKAKYMGVGVNDNIDVTIRLKAPQAQGTL